MILEQNTELKTMQLLVKYWYKNFSAAQIAKEAGISIPMVYNIVKKLSSKRIISNEGNNFKLNFNNPFSYAFKLYYDSERTIALSLEEQNKLNYVFEVMKKEYKYGMLAFILFGSTASNEQTEKSDLDLLVIVTKKQDIDYRKNGLLSIGKINIIEKEEKEFENEYFLASDLILNALMNGIIIFDTGVIRFLLKKPLPSPSPEIILEKKQRLDILKNRLLDLLKDKDYNLLVEEFKKFIIEKGRVLMIQKGIIPSSSKNILDNLPKLDKELFKDYKIVNKNNIKEVLQRNV